MADAVTLRYHKTFIDVDEKIPGLSRSSKSLPVLDSSGTLWGDDADEVGRSLYVEDLSKKLQEQWRSGMLPIDTKQATVMTPAHQAFIASSGSLGHPEVCHRPCMHFLEGLCHHGSACTFCHLPHPEKRSKFDKKQRQLLKNLSYEEFLVHTLPFIEDCLEKMQFDGSDLLDLLHAEVGEMPRMPRDRWNLSKVLGRMNLAGLMGMVRQKAEQTSEEPGDLVMKIDAVMTKIRENFKP